MKIKFEDDYSKLSREHKEAISAVVAMAMKKPGSIPVFVTFINTKDRQLEIIPVGDADMEDVMWMTKLTNDPGTKKQERTLFTNPESQN